jgi:hypothetical protein
MMPRTLEVTILLALDQLRWAPPTSLFPFVQERLVTGRGAWQWKASAPPSHPQAYSAFILLHLPRASDSASNRMLLKQAIHEISDGY